MYIVNAPVLERWNTLTDEEIDKISASIIAAVTKTSGGVLRA